MTPADPFTAGGKPQPPRDRGLLLGPANADNFRVKVGRYGDRWYTDQLPADGIADASEWVGPSVSTVKKASGSDWSFVALKRVNVALETKPTMFVGMPSDMRYETLKSINKIGLSGAGKRGTNVHTMCEDHLYGRPISINAGDPGWEYRHSVDQFFEMYNPTLVAAEAVAINRTLNGVGYGGTFDAILEIDSPASQRMRFLVDWKSRGEDSEHGAYPEEAAQVSGYYGADYMIVEGANGPERQPIPQLDGGLIVSIKPDGCRVYPIDLDVGFAHWTALHAWWVARRSERDSIGRSWAPRKIATGSAGRDNPTLIADPVATVGDGGVHAPRLGDGGAPTTPLAVAKAQLTVDPDQGADMTDPALYGETWAVLQRHFGELDAAAKAWIGELVNAGTRFGVPFHARQIRTARVYEIYRGLIALCAGMRSEEAA